MLDLIRNSEVPFNLMQSAAHGSLSVPPGEMIEILVYLALHHKLFGERARMTLAGWDEKASLTAASDPHTSAEVLGYFVARENLRPGLFTALAENPSVREEALRELAAAGARWIIEAMLASPRALNSPQLLRALQSNEGLRPKEAAEIAQRLAALGVDPSAEAQEQEVNASDAYASDEALDGTVAQYLLEHQAELEAEKDKPFRPIGMEHEAGAVEAAGEIEPLAAAAGSEGADAAKIGAERSAAAGAGKSASASAAAARKHSVPVHELRRDSTLQKISKLDIKGRIALAMRGSKEDRSILIRDSTKLVSAAVLDSPKVTESEVEAFASQKNVLDAVLRAIPMKRKFAKNYTIMRNLVYNPRTPIDASLPLMKILLLHDLKNLAENKEVSDTIRKAAMRLYRQRREKKD